jgi:outer membrane autotransporter protein
MKNRYLVSGAFAAALVMTASTSAMAQCVSTGGGGVAAAQFAPFASGGSLNALISAVNTANTAFLTQTTAFIGAPPNPKPKQEGGGVWVRGIGGEIETKAAVGSTFTFGNPVGTGAAGTVNCNASTKLEFAGTQVGTDMARLNWNGWNVHVGSMAGYMSAKASDTTGASVGFAPGSLTVDMEVPFVGVYAAATYGGFFIDGQIRWDFFQNRLNDPAQSGLFSQQVDARGIAFTGNIGYNWQLGNNWFIEPSAGIVVSKVEVDPIQASGTAVLVGSLVATSFPNTTRISDIESTLGRLSLRAGTTIVTDRLILQPFATASVFHDFGDSTTATYAETTAGLGALAGLNLVAGNITTQNVGTYGQFGAGVAGQLVGTGWLGYIRGDYRTGDRIEGYSFNGGLRYQFTPDPPVLAPKGLIGKAPVMVASPAINWTGFYVGGQFGAIYGEADIAFVPGPDTVDPRFAGPLAGGQIGYNRQFGKWVLGVEGNLNWTNANGARPCPNAFFFTCEVEMSWYGEGVAKVGYALFDRSWYYLKGGVAFAENTVSSRCNTGAGPTFFGVALAGCPVQSDTQQHVGWTVGFGSEFALTNNWFVRGETSYFDLGTQRYTYPNLAFAPRDAELTGFVSTVGINYRFSTGGR